MNSLELAKRAFFDGLAFQETGNYDQAERCYVDALRHAPDRPSILINLSAAQLKLRKFPQAADNARRATQIEPEAPEGWSNLGIALNELKRFNEAIEVLTHAIQRHPHYVEALLNQALAFKELGRTDEALSTCNALLSIEPENFHAMHVKSQLLGDDDPESPTLKASALRLYRNTLLERSKSRPVFSTVRQTSQKARCLVVNGNPGLDDPFRTFDDLQQHGNFPAQLIRLLTKDIHFSAVFVGDAGTALAREQIGTLDFILNNYVNGDTIDSQRHLQDLSRILDNFHVPVVNHPKNAILTTRDHSANLIRNLPGIRVPRIQRFRKHALNPREQAIEIETGFAYPLIVRDLSSQQGEGMLRIDSQSELIAYLAEGAPNEFFVIEFIDSRTALPYYRKIRAAFVAGQMTIMRVDFDTHWCIHGRKTEERAQFYLSHPELLATERAICRFPERELGQQTVEKLNALASRIPLDIFGIDFDVDKNGDIVFFEANASMNLFSTAHPSADYPKESQEKLRADMLAYFLDIATRG